MSGQCKGYLGYREEGQRIYLLLFDGISWVLVYSEGGGGGGGHMDHFSDFLFAMNLP